jgi:hypothetical protein
LAETAKTLELQPVGLQVLCIIGSSFGLFNSGSNSIFQKMFRVRFEVNPVALATRRGFSGLAVKDEACDFSVAG